MGLFSKKTEDTKKPKADVKPAVSSSTKTEPEAPAMKDLYAGTDTKPVVGKDAKTEKKARKYANAYRVIVKPLITEKAANVGSLNKYVFAVSKTTNKIEVSKAIMEIYGIQPENVNIVNVKGKKVRYGKINGVRSDWKKAIVTLPAGKTINIYEGV